MAADRDGDGESYEGAGDADDAPPDPRLWFLRDPGALVRRLVLAEILGEARGRGPSPGIASPGSPGHLPAKRR